MDDVFDLVYDSVWDSVYDSVHDSVRDLVCDSIWRLTSVSVYIPINDAIKEDYNDKNT